MQQSPGRAETASYAADLARNSRCFTEPTKEQKHGGLICLFVEEI